MPGFSLLRSVLVALLLGAVALPAVAQDRAAVSGYVRDAETGETLLGASVAVQGGGGGATNNQGFYALTGLPPGEVTLTASFLGYRPQRRTVTVAAGTPLRLDFELVPEGLVGEEVVVEAELPIEEEAQIGLTRVPVRLIQSIPSAFEADLFRSLQLLPGVKAANDFNSQLYVRGGSPDQTLILLDRTTVYNPTHFFGFFSTFNTDAIKDVQLWKGGYPAEYGGRLGAVVDVYNRDGSRNDTQGSVTLGLLASRASVDGPFSVGGLNGQFMLAARRSTLEPLLAVLRDQLDEDGIPESFYFYDVNAKLALDLSPNDRINVATYAGQDQVRVPLTSAAFRLNYGNRTGSLGYTRILSERAFLSANLTASRYFNYPVGEISTTEFTRNNTITDYSLRADLEVAATPSLDIQAGAWGGLLDLTLVDTFDGQEGLRSEIDARYLDGYAQATWRPGLGFILTAGARLETFQPGGYVRLAPRLRVERAFGDRLLVQAAYGRYHQFLSLISNEAFSGFDVWVTADDGVPPAYGDQFVLGLKTRPADGWRADAEVYFRTMEDLFEINPNLQDVAGLDYAEIFRFGQGYAGGLELYLEKGSGRLTGLVGYTLGVTRRRYRPGPFYPGSNLDPVTGEPRYFSPKYDRLHDLNAVVSYDLGRGWALTAAASYATGQAYTEPDARGSIDNNPLGTDLNFLISQQLNGQRLPPYHRLDLGFKKTGSFFSFADYELTLQAINVYSRRNIWFYQYDFSSNPVTRDAVKQLPILPNVSLRLDF